MVKGISRRVVVVRPDEEDVFEQAIFIVRDNGEKPRDMVREACAVADRYLRGTRTRIAGGRYTLSHLLMAYGAGMAFALAAGAIVWMVFF